jgi:small subunit ribosomal protein S18
MAYQSQHSSQDGYTNNQSGYNSNRRDRAPRPRRQVVTNDSDISYKNVDLLKHFVTEQGYLIGRSKTGLTQKQQRRLAQAIKRARHLALLPFTQTV